MCSLAPQHKRWFGMAAMLLAHVCGGDARPVTPEKEKRPPALQRRPRFREEALETSIKKLSQRNVLSQCAVQHISYVSSAWILVVWRPVSTG
jgi:hypothetical protein